MNKQCPTPGTWVMRAKTGIGFSVYAPCGDKYRQVAWFKFNWTPHDQHSHALYDARLCSAAPDLLNAARLARADLLFHLKSLGFSDDGAAKTESVVALTKAITKADPVGGV